MKKFLAILAIFFAAASAETVEIQQVTPQKIDQSILRSGEIVVLQFRGVDFRPGMSFYCDGPGGGIYVLKPLVFQEPTSATEFRLAKVVLPSTFGAGSWNVQPKLFGLVAGSTLFNAFEIVSSQLQITSISPSEVTGNYNQTTQVKISGSNFQQNLKIFVGRMEVDPGAIEVRPNEMNLKLKFRSGKRLAGGTHQVLVENPDKSRGTTELKVGLAEKSKPLPRQVAEWKIFLRVLLVAGITVLWIFAFLRWIPRYVNNWMPPAGTATLVSIRKTMRWSLRIMASGLAGFWVDLFGYPLVPLLQLFGFTFLLGLFFAWLAGKGKNFRDIFSGRCFKAYPVFWIAFVFWLVYIIVSFAGLLNR